MIAKGLEHTVLPGMRSRVTRIDGVTYLNDAYNANPGSMRAAFEHLAEFADPVHLVLLLGEMRELGAESEREHVGVFELAKRMFPGSRIATVGEGFRCAGCERHFESASEARSFIAEARAGDLVFVKGSRGIAAEEALPAAAR